MTTKTTNILFFSLTALAFALAAALYPSLPEWVASHWNAAGEADGYMGKFFGVFLFPILMAGFFALYAVIPNIDPLKGNINAFRSSYNAFWAYMLGFFFYIFCLFLAWNLGWRFDFSVAMIPAAASLFFAIGILLEKSKRNWFVGIRTPWTLSSDVVWEKTHRLGGKLFKVAAALPLLGLFWRDDAFIIAAIAAPVAIVTITVIAYSYFEYRKLPQRPGGDS